MKFRKLSIRNEKEEWKRFDPVSIVSVDIQLDKITLVCLEPKKKKAQSTEDLKTKTYVLKKKNYYYPHWDYFITQLNNIFEL